MGHVLRAPLQAQGSSNWTKASMMLQMGPSAHLSSTVAKGRPSLILIAPTMTLFVSDVGTPSMPSKKRVNRSFERGLSPTCNAYHPGDILKSLFSMRLKPASIAQASSAPASVMACVTQPGFGAPVHFVRARVTLYCLLPARSLASSSSALYAQLSCALLLQMSFWVQTSPPRGPGVAMTGSH